MLKHLDGFTMKVICPQFPFLILEDEVTVEPEQITLRTANKATKLNRSIILIYVKGGLRPASVFCESSVKLRVLKLLQQGRSLKEFQSLL